ncbi:MAG: hypothetical protein IJM15_06620 [Erysipelotrichaceae bacterium]|nr:hypothetical protein [Erysipelotrichaceae bacterium]
MNRKKVLILLSVTVILAGWLTCRKIIRENSLTALKDSLFLELEIPEYFEAKPETLNTRTLVKASNGQELSVSSSSLDLSESGLYWLRFAISASDKYGQIAEKGISIPVFIRDTNDPVITFNKEKVSFIAGDSFDPLSNILSVTDENYPDLEYTNTLTKGTYTVESDVDSSKAGDYSVTVKAMDLNGNICEASYLVKVEKKTDLIPGIDYIYDGRKLTRTNGTIYGPSGKETYYNLPMGGVIRIMRRLGYTEEKYPYWIREDGCKMFGDYIMIAADLKIRPRGSLVMTSLGMGIVCDTGAFIKKNPHQIDIAVNW